MVLCIRKSFADLRTPGSGERHMQCGSSHNHRIAAVRVSMYRSPQTAVVSSTSPSILCMTTVLLVSAG
eukprot:20100-Eustigmatos_ZCMA.PRE.1